MSVLRCLAFPLLAAALLGQDPVPPPGGFPINQQLDQLIQWSDGYWSRVDVRYPAAAPGPNGWPGIQVIHGGGTSRKNVVVREIAILLAQYGYATFAYDVRGQGDTVALNPGMPGPFGYDRILLDSAECFYVIEARLGALLDSARLGVTGRSQGGTHCRRAAAFSGRALPLAGYVANYPVIGAVAMQITGLDELEDMTPGGGTMLTSHAAASLGVDKTTTLWADALAARFGAVRAALAADPVFRLLPRIQTNNVPVFAMMAWDDKNHEPYVTLDSLQTLLPGMPVKALATTGGHGAPENDVERLLIQTTTKRWFDRFLKNAANGITGEPTFELAVTPLAAAQYLSAASHWQHRLAPVWPPIAPVTPFYLRANGVLGGAPPGAPEPAVQIKHAVPTAYDLNSYWNDGSGENPATVFASVPMISHAFESAPLPQEVELLGRPTFVTEVRALQGDFQFSVALLIKDPAGNERYLVGGTGAVRNQMPGTFPVVIELRDVAAIVPAGSRFVIRVENLDHMRPPGIDYLFTTPLLLNYDIALQLTPAAGTRIELPIVPRGVGLTPRVAQVTAAGGFSHPITIDAGPARAGMNYALFLGTSGFAPGVSLAPGVTLPLNVDAWTPFAAGFANSPYFPGYVGVLNAQGRATASMNVPAAISPALTGLGFTQAGILIGGAQLHTTGPAQLGILP